MEIVDTLPACADLRFTHLPLDSESFDYILPLGNFNPPGHVLPTDHLYFALARDSSYRQISAKVYAPADITIVAIATNENYAANGSLVNKDGSISFAPCRDVRLSYGHVAEFSDELKQAIAREADECSDYVPPPLARSHYCRWWLNLSVPAGTFLGWTGSVAAFDFGAVDTRIEKLPFINPDRYIGDQLRTVCPLDFYSGELKASLYRKLGNPPRTIEPRCGTIMQDVPGTAQGNWFSERQGTGIESNAVALAHDNSDPTIGIISDGGSLGGGALAFMPRTTGTINREFSTITPGSAIYCYYNDDPEHHPGYGAMEGKTILQLRDTNMLLIEHREGSCSDAEKFQSPVTFMR
jgi:hypothetical protein